MRKLSSFTFITLNGYFKGLNEDTSWHHQLNSKEAASYAEQSSSSGNTLLFGRKTYEMMYSFWPTPQAAELFPTVAGNMNKAAKIVFSNTLKDALWENSSLISGNIVEQVKSLKQTPGSDLTILGSGSIVSQFSDAGLIDEYQIMLDPVAIGKGTSIFGDIQQNLNLKLISSKVFEKDGIVLLHYQKR